MFQQIPVSDLPLGFDPRARAQDSALQSLLVEAQHGDHKARPMTWLRRLLGISSAVGRVMNEFGETVGTGFLGDLDTPYLRGTGFITADHVAEAIERTGNRMYVSFDERPDGVLYTVRPVWRSPVDKLDTYVAVLEPTPCRTCLAPHESHSLSLAQAEPKIWLPLLRGGRRRQRVYAVGYPNGGALSMGIEDNLLKHIVSRRGNESLRVLLHMAHTEPGSSGSPLISEELEVIAVHRAGRDTTQSRSYIARALSSHNEATSIVAILEAMHRSHPGF